MTQTRVLPPVSSIREIDEQVLPIPRVEIELSDIEDDLASASDWGDASRVMALVRLHTYPLGVVYLDGRLGPSRRLHAAGIWTVLNEAINAHLSADGLPVASRIDDVVVASTSGSPRCLQYRDSVLSRGSFISVVVATRDRPDSLAACLKSLLRSSYQHFEIIVVDNDPTSDDTELMIRRRFPSVRYVRECRRGLASAHNCGLSLAQGQITAFVDDDVLVDAQWLVSIAEGFAVTDRVGCVTGLILPAQLDTPAQLLLEHRGGYGKGFDLQIFDTHDNRPADPLFPFAAGRLGSGANMAFDTRKLRELGGFDAALGVGTFARGGDDLIGIFRTIVAGHRVVYQPAAIVWHRHYRDLTALRNMAHGCGVGMGAFLASGLVHEPRMLISFVRCLPACFVHLARQAGTGQRGRPGAWPAEFVRVERRGLLTGPVAYAVSRWRARRAVADRGDK
ncbi:glycosyltransferase family 2 protein [Mycolicibacterium tokaiense]|uniref:Glycosyl transferase family protein n=1 Tax=Mycolicibacterium tokaiense TaxID=39695 RepID=A0A378TER7_9MYCO|nr:glycosyltransferase [Mycolicibacterium tokaiense]BBY86478.1 hypothetical protein MTOK_22600 [Mycolicibacterium tokaiense]STZ59014.1 glycosyl transferase family protein [Mycolicibacterium tokaiense]